MSQYGARIRAGITSRRGVTSERCRQPAYSCPHVQAADIAKRYDLVVSINLRRRHLSESQRAMAMASLCQLERGRPKPQPIEGEFEAVENGQICPISRDQAADKAGVHPNTMKSAMKVDRHGSPELVEAVKKGEVSVSGETSPPFDDLTNR